MPYGTTAYNRGKGLELWLWLVHNPGVTVITSKLRIITPGLRVLDEYILKIMYIPSPIAPWSSPYIPRMIAHITNKIITFHMHRIQYPIPKFISNCWWHCWWCRWWFWSTTNTIILSHIHDTFEWHFSNWDCCHGLFRFSWNKVLLGSHENCFAVLRTNCKNISQVYEAQLPLPTLFFQCCRAHKYSPTISTLVRLKNLRTHLWTERNFHYLTWLDEVLNTEKITEKD